MDGLLLLLFMAASGVCAVSLKLNRQYFFYYEPKTRDAAQTFCRERHTDLATITDMEDVNALRSMVDVNLMEDGDFSARAWIGLYDAVDSWRWSLSDQSLYPPGEAPFTMWAPGQPDNKDSAEHCVMMYEGGAWNDAPCDWLIESVCCDGAGPNVTFVLIFTPMTWTAAQSYCREHHTDLASARTVEENQRIMDLVPAGGEGVWIGLHRDSWRWSDESDATFRYWSPRLAEPNNLFSGETCVAANFNESGGWEDWTCSWTGAYICYSQDEDQLKVKVITLQVHRLVVQQKDSSLDLNQPAVMKRILVTMAQRLKEDGLHESTELSWREQANGNVLQKLKGG